MFPERSGSQWFSDLMQDVKEFREGNAHTLTAPNVNTAFAEKPRHSKCHRDPMIAVALDFRAMKLLPAFHSQSIREFFHLCAHAAQLRRHGRQPNAYFPSEALGSGEPEALFRSGTNNSQ